MASDLLSAWPSWQAGRWQPIVKRHRRAWLLPAELAERLDATDASLLVEIVELTVERVDHVDIV